MKIKKLDDIKDELIKYKNSNISYPKLADLIKKEHGIDITPSYLSVYCKNELGFPARKAEVRSKLDSIKNELLKYKNSNISYQKLAEIIESDFGIKVSYVMLNTFCKSELGFPARKAGARSKLDSIKNELIKYKNSKVSYPELADLIKKEYGIEISKGNLSKYCKTELGFSERKNKLDSIKNELIKYKNSNITYPKLADLIKKEHGIEISKRNLSKYCKTELGFSERKNKLDSIKNELIKYKNSKVSYPKLADLIKKEYGIEISTCGLQRYCKNELGFERGKYKKLNTIKHELIKYKNSNITYQALADIINKKYEASYTSGGLYIYCRKKLGFNARKTNKIDDIKDELIKYKNYNITYQALVDIINKKYEASYTLVGLYNYCRKKLGFEDRKSGIKNSKLDLIKNELIKYKNSKVSYPELADLIKKEYGIEITEEILRKYCIAELGFAKRKKSYIRKNKKLDVIKNELLKYNNSNITYKKLADLIKKEHGIKISGWGLSKYCEKELGFADRKSGIQISKLEFIKNELIKYKNSNISYQKLADLIKKEYEIDVTPTYLSIYCKNELGFERGKNSRKLDSIKNELIKYKNSNISYPKLAKIIERDFNIRVSAGHLRLLCINELGFPKRIKGL